MSWRNDRAHYNYLKAHHRCVECGCKKQPGITTVRCPSCNERRNAKRNAERRKWYEAGLCRTCGSPVRNGHTRCAQCLWDKHHSRQEPMQEKRKRKPEPRVDRKTLEKWTANEPFIDPRIQLIEMKDLLLMPVIVHPLMIELCIKCKSITCQRGTCERYRNTSKEIKKLQKIMREGKRMGSNINGNPSVAASRDSSLCTKEPFGTEGE